MGIPLGVARPRPRTGMRRGLWKAVVRVEIDMHKAEPLAIAYCPFVIAGKRPVKEAFDIRRVRNPSGKSCRDRAVQPLSGKNCQGGGRMAGDQFRLQKMAAGGGVRGCDQVLHHLRGQPPGLADFGLADFGLADWRPRGLAASRTGGLADWRSRDRVAAKIAAASPLRKQDRSPSNGMTDILWPKVGPRALIARRTSMPGSIDAARNAVGGYGRSSICSSTRYPDCSVIS
jgi:hypothetical protein